MGDAFSAIRALDSRVTPRRLQLAAALLVLNLGDVLLTRMVLARGGVEANPMMQDLMQGLAAPLGVKAAVAVLAGLLLMCCPARSRIAEPAVAAVVGLYLVVVLWNIGVLAVATFA